MSWRHDILAEVADFCRKRRDFCLETKSVPQVALLHNPVDYYAKNDPLYCLGESTRALEGALHALLQNNLPVDVLNDITLARRINQYPLVVIPEPESLCKELIDACKEYVHNGGNLLISGAYGPGIFSDLLGVEPVGEPENGTYSVISGKEMVSLSGLWQSVKSAGAHIISHIHNGEEPQRDSLDMPAVTINYYGKGKVIGIYAPVFQFFRSNPYPRLRRFIGEAVAAFENRNIVQVNAQPWVEVSLRKKDDRLLLHLLNKATGHPLSAENHAVEEIPVTGPIKITMQLAERPKGVSVYPEDDRLVYKWSNSVLEVELPGIHIHSIIAIDT